MRYLLLIHIDETGFAQAGDGEAREMMDAYRRYTDAIQAEGIMRGGDALQPSGTATVVRVRDGEALITDGPFAEGKEHLGGLLVIQAPDLDAALAWADKQARATTLPIEVRPFHSAGLA